MPGSSNNVCAMTSVSAGWMERTSWASCSTVFVEVDRLDEGLEERGCLRADDVGREEPTGHGIGVFLTVTHP